MFINLSYFSRGIGIGRRAQEEDYVANDPRLLMFD